MPNATPQHLVLALGKDGNAYLVNRDNLGGITTPVASLPVDGVTRGQSSASYHTNQGTYFVFRTGSGGISAYKVTATNPPTIAPAWNVNQNGQGSPWVTTTDGSNNAIVWVVGAQGDNRLHGYNGDTGAVVYAGGGNNELMTGTRKWNSGIVARGRIYVANNNKVYKFRVPGGTPTPTPAQTPTPTPTPTPTATPTPTTKCATPYYGPAPGPYNAADYPKTIVIHCDTRGVSIRFTRDGTTPTTKHGTLIAREGTAIVSAGQTLKAIAFADGYVNSNIASGDYVSATTVGTPTFTPAGGTYRNFSGHVTIATPTAGATIRWTQDGTTPSPTHGNRLVGGTALISIGANGIGLRAIAKRLDLPIRRCISSVTIYDPDTGGDGYLP